MKEYEDQSELVDLATLKKKKLPYVDIHALEKAPSLYRNRMERRFERDWHTGKEREWYEFIDKWLVWRVDWYNVLIPPYKDHPKTEYDETCINGLKNFEEFLKEHGLTDFKNHDKYDNAIGYRDMSLSSFVVFQLFRLIEKNIGKEICYIYPRGFNDCLHPGWNTKLRWWDWRERSWFDEADSNIRFFFEDFSDLKELVEKFNELLKEFIEKTAFGKCWQENITFTDEYKSAKPRAPKKNVEPSDEEKLSIAQSRLNEILCSTSDELLDYLKNKKLLDDFKKSFIDKYTKQSFTTISIDADVMFGDADGTHHKFFTMSFDEWDYLKEWWTAYRQKYPAEEDAFEMDHPIFSVGYQESGEGAWKICVVDKLLEDKTVKVFDFDNGYSTVRMNVSKDENAKFENRYEGITDRPDSEAYYEELPDMLDAYAAYWYAMDKKDEALIELPEIW